MSNKHKQNIGIIMEYRYEISTGLAWHLFEYFSTNKLREYLDEIGVDLALDNDDLCDECRNKNMTHPITMDDSRFNYSLIESRIEVSGFGYITRYTTNVICKKSGTNLTMTIDNFESEINGIIDCKIWSEIPKEFLAYITEKSNMDYQLKCSNM